MTSACRSCHRAATAQALEYRKGAEKAHYPNLLQCDVCERELCSDCLEIYDILSGHDFLCHDCAHQFRVQGGPISARTS